MAYRITAICDRCKKEETQEAKYFNNHQWREVTLEVPYYNNKTYLFCIDCQKEIGIIKPEKPQEAQQVRTVADRLFDCIAEIVAETAPRE